MKTMQWLLKREYWENKGMLLWAPVSVSGLIVLAAIGETIHRLLRPGVYNYVKQGQDAATTAFDRLPPQIQSQVADGILFAAATPAMVAAMATAFIMSFYCLNAMYEERRDRSVLFWKSLPVSDGQTVLSKVLIAQLLAPLASFGIALVAGLLVLLLGIVRVAIDGGNVAVPVLSNASIYMMPLKMLGMMPVWALWALPCVGWYLLVSSWARSKAFLWAFVTPVMGFAIVRLVAKLFHWNLNLDWLVHHVLMRGLGGLFPGIGLAIETADIDHPFKGWLKDGPADVFGATWHSLQNAEIWVGALVGIVMIYAAIRIRGIRDEA